MVRSSLPWRQIAILALAFWLSAWPARSEVICDDGHRDICIETQHSQNGVVVYGINRFDHLPVSLTMVFELDNLRIKGRRDEVFVLPPRAKTQLLVLTRKAQGRWSYNFRFTWNRGDATARHDDRYVYRLPFAPGAGYRVSQGCHGAATHHGAQKYAVDFDMPRGSPIHAARGGKVVHLREDSRRGGRGEAYRDDSNYIVIQHADGTLGLYFHLRPNGVVVKLGQNVTAGQLIGRSGNTGQSTGPHLHFAVTKGGKGQSDLSLPIRFETTKGRVTCPRVGRMLHAPK